MTHTPEFISAREGDKVNAVGKGGKVDCGVASDGLGADETALDRIEVEGAMDGMVGKGEHHGAVHLAEECIVAGSVGGNGGAATQTGVFGTGAVEEGLETGVALQPDEGVGGHYTGGLHIGSPMIARDDAAAAVLKAATQDGVHAVRGELDHGHGKSPTKSGVGGGIGSGESVGFLFFRDKCGLIQLHVGTTAEACVFKVAGLVFESCPDIFEVGGDVGSSGGVELHVQAVGELAEEMVHFAASVGFGLLATVGVAFAFGKPVGCHVALVAETSGVDRAWQDAATIWVPHVLGSGTMPEEEFCAGGGKVGAVFRT